MDMRKTRQLHYRLLSNKHIEKICSFDKKNLSVYVM